MNHHEAKFILRARRPNGQDGKDPVFADAMAKAENDPLLKSWVENEAAFDRAMMAKLGEIPAPAGLKEAILAGARASQQRRRSWWKNPAWIGVAAAIAFVALVAARFGPSRPSVKDFSEYALHELATAHDNHNGHRPDMAAVQGRLTNSTLPLPGHVKLNADELSRNGCRVVSFAGRQVFEICFQRDGYWYHLYASRVDNFSASGVTDAKTLVKTEGHFTSTAWKDDQFAYALVTYDGADALRRVI